MMLQTSPHLSKVCGHSHIKKFWLMQTQNESQASVGCDKNGNLASSSCFFTSASVTSSAIKHGSGVAAGMRSLMAGGSSSKSPDRATASGVGTALGRGGVTGTAKLASLVTCAESLSPPLESLSPPLQANILRRSAGYTSSGGNADSEDTDGSEDSKDDGSDGEGHTVFKSPPRNKSDFSTTSSGSGFPFGDSHRAESSLNLAEDSRFQNTKNLLTGEVMSRLRPPGAAPYVGSLDLIGGFKNNVEFPPESPSQVGASISADTSRSNPLLPKNCVLSNETSKGIADCGYFNKSGQSPFKHVGEREACKADARPCSRTLMLSDWDISAAIDVPGDHANDDTDDGLADEVRVHDLNRWDCSNGRSMLRTCSHCGTSKTPLWRSGPLGPKSLCNACGIRFKKPRRCPTSVCEGLDWQGSPPSTPSGSKFMSRSIKRKHDSSVFSLSSCFQEDEVGIVAEEQGNRQSKRKRLPALSLTKGSIAPQGEDTTGSSGESCLTWTMHSPVSVSPSPWKASIHNKKDTVESLSLEKQHPHTQVFDKEEEEAAVLLMALSCGVVDA